MPNKGYKTVKDSQLQAIWECEQCGNDCSVGPDWYECNGTPVCPECDIDMAYIRTEMKK